jgi:hypothetical protein
MINLLGKTVYRLTIVPLILFFNMLSLEIIKAQESAISIEMEKAFSAKILSKEDVLILHNIGILEEISSDVIQDPNILFDLSDRDLDSLREIGINQNLLASFKKKVGSTDELARIRTYIVEGSLKGSDLIIVDGKMNNHEDNDLFRRLMASSKDISEEVKREIKGSKRWEVRTEHGIETMNVTPYPHNFGELTIQETIALLKMFIGYSKEVSSELKVTLQEADLKIGGKNLSTVHISTIKKLLPNSSLKNIFLLNFETKELIRKGLPLPGPFGIPSISWPETGKK